MSTATERRTITVALIGNPNTGKSTLFSALAGVHQRIGNYPGVTVEKKIGRAEFAGRRFQLIDLPGTYSLAPESPDEMIAVDVLLGRRTDVPPPDVIVCIVDASNLQRNLYLVSQVLELARPTVIALNMMDVAGTRGIELDTELLSRNLGAPVVPLQAHRRVGLDALRACLARAADQSQLPVRTSPLPAVFVREVDSICAALRNNGNHQVPRYLIERLILDTGYLEQARLAGVDQGVRDAVAAARGRLADVQPPLTVLEAISRYQWVAEVTAGVCREGPRSDQSWSDRIDQLLTHRVWGTVIFIVTMILLFQSVFRFALPLMNGVEWIIRRLGEVVARGLPEGALESLAVDGVIGGVGSVLVFIPQIAILFFFIAMLEDCGYMARAAFLMDRLMSRVGLSGKSFIPLLSSFACAIPGIMAARVVENRRDRLVTILIAPLMSCSARLPVYTLMIAAFIPARSFLGGLVQLQGMTLFAMYLVGIVTAIAVAWILRTAIVRGAAAPFVMELPAYKTPGLRMVVHRMVERSWAFVRRAGTLILAVSILVWALGYYPHHAGPEEAELRSRLAAVEAQLAQLDATKGPASQRGQQLQRARRRSPDLAEEQRQRLLDRQTQLANALSGAYRRHSLLGQMGHAVEPLVKPLGWDWRLGCAAIASFPAREVVVGTLGVLFNLGEEQNETSPTLREQLQQARWDDTGAPLFTIPVALSLMVFFALCAQCASTLVVMRRETASWLWPLFTFAYMTTLAYMGAWATFRLASWFTHA